MLSPADEVVAVVAAAVGATAIDVVIAETDAEAIEADDHCVHL